MVILCKGPSGKSVCRINVNKQALPGSKPPRCRKCTPMRLRADWGGDRKCYTTGCGNIPLTTDVSGDPKSFLREPKDVLRCYPYCKECTKIIQDDSKCSMDKVAKAKLQDYLATRSPRFLIFVRRYGRPHLLHTRASKILTDCGLPFLSFLTKSDAPKCLSSYLHDYASRPQHYIFGPLGADCITNFANSISAGILQKGRLVHVMDDNVERICIGQKRLSIAKKHFVSLLLAGEKAVQSEKALSFSCLCSSWDEKTLDLDAGAHWSSNKKKLLSYTTYPRLLFGGFCGMTPTVSKALLVNACSSQEDVFRTCLHYNKCGKIILFPHFKVVKTINEKGGCVSSAGSVEKRERQNHEHRLRILHWVEENMTAARRADIKNWWRRSKFLRPVLEEHDRQQRKKARCSR